MNTPFGHLALSVVFSDQQKCDVDLLVQHASVRLIEPWTEILRNLRDPASNEVPLLGVLQIGSRASDF